MITIVIDEREQQPWSFRDMARTVRGTLPAGDYALRGDFTFAIERKSIDDFVGTLSSGWARFRRELERMQRLDFPARIIIVEASWIQILGHQYNHPDVPPHFILKRVAELALDGVQTLFCDDPIGAAGLAWKILSERKQRLEDGKETD